MHMLKYPTEVVTIMITSFFCKHHTSGSSLESCPCILGSQPSVKPRGHFVAYSCLSPMQNIISNQSVMKSLTQSILHHTAEHFTGPIHHCLTVRISQITNNFRNLYFSYGCWYSWKTHGMELLHLVSRMVLLTHHLILRCLEWIQTTYH